MQTIYCYAPDSRSQQLLQHDYDRWAGTHSNFVAWVAPTYYHLKKAGFSLEIVDKMPREGIVLADRDTLGDGKKYLDKVMLVCAKSDREFHPSAHIHVVHNRGDVPDKRNALWNPYFISHWPLPGLIPRDRSRGNSIENVAYIGTRSQLASELRSSEWQEALAAIGCRWLPIFEPERWNDYRSIDLVVAARTFDRQSYLNKGAIKLYNCWRAGVPALLAPESAFLQERESDLDFTEVNSLDKAIDAVKALKNDPERYGAMVERALERGRNVTTEATVEQWSVFFRDFVFPRYEEFRQLSEVERRTLFARRYLRLQRDRLPDRLARLIARPAA
jgi:hypothetical protein